MFTLSGTSTSDIFIKSLPISEHLFRTYCIPSTIGTGLGPGKTAENKAGEASAFTGLPGLCVRWAMNVTSKSRSLPVVISGMKEDERKMCDGEHRET